jgi:4-hydroxy-tetrahydrodipicolinate synthase
MDQVSELVGSLGAKFDVLSGDDAMTLPMLSVGGKGIISVIANIIPRDLVDLCTSWFRGDTKTAVDLHLKMFPLVKSLFIETNPIPIKTAMGILGLCLPELRLPLCPMEDKNRVKLELAMREYGLKW